MREAKRCRATIFKKSRALRVDAKRAARTATHRTNKFVIKQKNPRHVATPPFFQSYTSVRVSSCKLFESALGRSGKETSYDKEDCARRERRCFGSVGWYDDGGLHDCCA